MNEIVKNSFIVFQAKGATGDSCPLRMVCPNPGGLGGSFIAVFRVGLLVRIRWTAGEDQGRLLVRIRVGLPVRIRVCRTCTPASGLRWSTDELL